MGMHVIVYKVIPHVYFGGGCPFTQPLTAHGLLDDALRGMCWLLWLVAEADFYLIAWGLGNSSCLCIFLLSRAEIFDPVGTERDRLASAGLQAAALLSRSR